MLRVNFGAWLVLATEKSCALRAVAILPLLRARVKPRLLLPERYGEFEWRSCAASGIARAATSGSAGQFFATSSARCRRRRTAASRPRRASRIIGACLLYATIYNARHRREADGCFQTISGVRQEPRIVLNRRATVEAVMRLDASTRARYCYNQMSVAAQKAANPTSETELGGMRILVVDDHEDARELVAYILEHAGAIVERADSAEMARRVLARAPLDALVSDIGMPMEDGYELMRQVRTGEISPGVRNIPALAVTAFGSAQDRHRALAAGFQDHLPKPINAEKLKTALARIVSFSDAR